MCVQNGILSISPLPPPWNSHFPWLRHYTFLSALEMWCQREKWLGVTRWQMESSGSHGTLPALKSSLIKDFSYKSFLRKTSQETVSPMFSTLLFPYFFLGYLICLCPLAPSLMPMIPKSVCPPQSLKVSFCVSVKRNQTPPTEDTKHRP